MKKHKLRNILLMTLGIIVIAGADCGYIFRREIKFYYTSYRIERYNKKRYDTQKIDIKKVYPKKDKEYSSEEEKRAYLARYRFEKNSHDTSFYGDDDLSYYFGLRYISRFDLINTEPSFTDHSDDPNVCKKCFMSNGYNKKTKNANQTQIMLFENSSTADILYNLYKERWGAKYGEGKWEYVLGDPYSYHKYSKSAEANNVFFYYEYFPNSNGISLSIIYVDDNMFIDAYYYGKCGEDLKGYLDVLDSSGIPIPDEVMDIPHNIASREE